MRRRSHGTAIGGNSPCRSRVSQASRSLSSCLKRRLTGTRSGARLLVASAQCATVENHLKALHVGRDDDDAAVVVGKPQQCRIDFMLQVLGREAAVDDVVGLGNTFGTFDFDLRVFLAISTWTCFASSRFSASTA